MIVKPYLKENHRTPVRLLEITHREVGIRLDRFLKEQWPDAPLSLIQKLLRTGQVRVNSKRKKGNHRLQMGEQVRLPPLTLPPASKAASEGRCPAGMVREVAGRILYRDDSLLVLNKPAGMAVHGGSKQRWGAVDAVRDYMALEGAGGKESLPELCHRLDRDTSGCLLFGLGKYATRTLTAAFREGTLTKGYLALVKGRPHPARGVIDKPLQKGVVRAGERMVVTTRKGEGQEARTHYETERIFTSASLVSVTLETGRTHQIRAHFQAIGCPVVGDGKYGDRHFNQQMKSQGVARLFLHASHLVINHPEKNKKIEILAPLDPVLKKSLDRLQ
ncbi:MAG: RluA family pseudouridine synthase [Magnetococcales bacterium]|nr:RluA family pseudouridine synthase [Magnetococcales bacterium]